MSFGLLRILLSENNNFHYILSKKKKRRRQFVIVVFPDHTHLLFMVSKIFTPNCYRQTMLRNSISWQTSGYLVY